MQFKNKFQISINSSTYPNIEYLSTYLLFMLTQNKIYNLKLCYISFPKKIKKFTILKSPHIFKTARTQLEIQNLKKNDNNYKFKEIKQLQAVNEIFHNIIKNLPAMIKLQLKYFKMILI